MTETVYFPEFRIYKPTKSNTGAASAIQTKMTSVKGRHELQLFWVATKQVQSKTKNAAFAWKDKEQTVTMKLGDPDVGEILAVLRGVKDSMGRKESKDKPGKGLFHQNPNGNTTMTLQANYNDATGEPSYYIRLASKSKQGKLIEVKHSITVGEAEFIRVLLEHWVLASYGWNGQLPVGLKVEEVSVPVEESVSNQ